MATNFTEEDERRLAKAITQGVLEVEFADSRRIRFSTFEELVSRWTFVRQQLGLEAGRERLVSEFKKGVTP